MYNPFKPHICQFNNGTYGIRRLSGFLWVYLDKAEAVKILNAPFWWYVKEWVLQHCTFDTKESARATLVIYTKNKPLFEFSSKKV
jgi:hypothetical protein